MSFESKSNVIQEIICSISAFLDQTCSLAKKMNCHVCLRFFYIKHWLLLIPVLFLNSWSLKVSVFLLFFLRLMLDGYIEIVTWIVLICNYFKEICHFGWYWVSVIWGSIWGLASSASNIVLTLTGLLSSSICSMNMLNFVGLLSIFLLAKQNIVFHPYLLLCCYCAFPKYREMLHFCFFLL